jgi:hypothetical protein
VADGGDSSAAGCCGGGGGRKSTEQPAMVLEAAVENRRHNRLRFRSWGHQQSPGGSNRDASMAGDTIWQRSL